MHTGDQFLDGDALRAATFVRHVEIHDTLGSTNDRAAELARDPNIEMPALVVARLQTAGKGRGANRWWSADGALTFSLLLDPAALGVGTSNWPQLSLATAVAVCDALQAGSMEHGARSDNNLPTPRSPLPAPCSIKWPNDVVLDGRKVCGILIESPGGSAPAKDRLIIGIGVNVNNSWRSAPPEVGAHGTALCDFTGRMHSLQHVLADLLEAIEQRIIQVAAQSPELPIAWRQFCCLTDEIVTITSDSGTTTGRCLGIADDGALRVQSEIKTEAIYSGSVSVRNRE